MTDKEYATSIETMNGEWWTLELGGAGSKDSKPRACIGRKQAFDRAVQELGEPLLPACRDLACRYVEGQTESFVGESVWLESPHKRVHLRRWMSPGEHGW